MATEFKNIKPFEIRAQMERKPSSLIGELCRVERVVCISDEEFIKMCHQPLADSDIIHQNLDCMYEEDGMRHCLMIVPEHKEQGLIVDSSGYDYARYASLVAKPAAFLEQMTYQHDEHWPCGVLADTSAAIKDCTEMIAQGIELGVPQVQMSFDEIEEKIPNLGLRADRKAAETILDALYDNKFIADVEMDFEDGILLIDYDLEQYMGTQNKALTSARMISPLHGTFQYSDQSVIGAETTAQDVSAKELILFARSIQRQITLGDCALADQERGLAVNLSDDLQSRVHSLQPHVEIIGGQLWAVTAVSSWGPLSEDESKTLSRELANEFDCGWGKEFAEHPLEVDGGCLTVKFGSDEMPFLAQEGSVFDNTPRKTQNMTM